MPTSRWNPLFGLLLLFLIVGVLHRGHTEKKTLKTTTNLKQRSPASLGGLPVVVKNFNSKKADLIEKNRGTLTANLVESVVKHQASEAHDHSDCEEALKMALFDGDTPDPKLSEQEKFDLLFSDPLLEEAYNHYVEFMIGPDGEEIRRQEAEQSFDDEIDHVQAEDVKFEMIQLDI